MKLLKNLKRFRTRKVQELKILEVPDIGLVLDVMSMPNGHLACNKCNSAFFFVEKKSGIIVIHCKKCFSSLSLLFPPYLLEDICSMVEGQFNCRTHPNTSFALIKNKRHLSIGCKHCKTEICFELYNPDKLIIPKENLQN